MWTPEDIEKWRLRRIELDIEDEFRKASPKMIADCKKMLTQEEQDNLDRYLLKIKTEDAFFLKLYEDSEREKLEKTAEYKRRAALNKKFKIERTLQKLIKKCNVK